MVRRVYTAVDSQGRSGIAEDSQASSVHRLEEAGLVFHELWRTTGPLASNVGTVDPVAPELVVMPEAGGTALRVVELAPHRADQPVELHESPTTDYNVVLEGAVTAVSDTGEVRLTQGDVLIQRGGRHGWRNDGPSVCVFASVMIADR